VVSKAFIEIRVEKKNISFTQEKLGISKSTLKGHQKERVSKHTIKKSVCSEEMEEN
jgi:hypothetical protein